MLRLPLVRAFIGWARWRLAGALALALAGAAVEGIGLVMLVPIIGAMLGGELSETGTLAQLTGWLVPGGGADALGPVLGFFAVLMVARAGLLHWRNILLVRLEQDFVAEMRLDIFRRMAEAPWRSAAQLAHGRLHHALGRNLDRSASAVGALLRAASAGVLLAVQAGIALWLAPWLTLVVASLAALVLKVLAPMRLRAAELGRSMTEEDYRLFSTAAGFLGGLKAAKAHGLERDYLARFSESARGFGAQIVAVLRNQSAAGLLLQTAAALLALGTFYVGARGFGMAPETLLVVLVLMVRLSGPLQALQATALTAHHGNAAYAGALEALSGLAPGPGPTPGGAGPWPTAPGFRLESVTRGPDPGAPPVLEGLSAEIPAGAVTAIAGPSGVGKTTLCDLLAGLDTPDAGVILIDGAPFSAEARAALGQSLAYVGQAAVPLQATLRESLTWGTPPQEDDALWSALATVGAEELVRAAPAGLDTELRIDGSHFSGGERQRFALARALLRAPRLLILDEATNALDIAAEQQVLGALLAARNGATVILVSHRPSALSHADHVITLT